MLAPADAVEEDAAAGGEHEVAGSDGAGVDFLSPNLYAMGVFTTDDAAAPPDIKLNGAPTGVVAVVVDPAAAITLSALCNNAGVDIADASTDFLLG